MATINQLSAVDSVQDSDLVPIYSSSSGDARKAAMSVLAAYMQGKITSTDDKVTQYAAPSATGFNVNINGNAGGIASNSVWLILTPVGAYANGQITMPVNTSCKDKQELLVNCTQAVTTLAVSGNGATVTGAPTTLAANGSFRLRFDMITNTWYKV
jgi:hypothetical protein